MAYIVTEINNHTDVRILSGKYLVFNMIMPVSNHPGLIKPDTNITYTGYELAGCRFPNKDTKESESQTVEDDIKTDLAGQSNIYFINMSKERTRIFESTEERIVSYKWINGLIFDSTGNNQVETSVVSGYFPIYADTDKTYYIYDGTVYTLTLSDPNYKPDENEDLVIPKYVLSSGTISLSDEELLFVSQGSKLTNDTIMLSSMGADPSIYADPKVDASFNKPGVVPINSPINYKINIYAGIITTSESSEFLDDIPTGYNNVKIIKPEILNKSFTSKGYCTYENNKALLLPRISSGTTTELDQYFDALSTEQATAVNSEIGMWSNPYWKNTIKDNGYPARTSYSAISTFASCPYRYFTGVMQNSSYYSSDKGTLLVLTKPQATILGDILHRHGEYILAERMQNDAIELSDSRVKQYKQAAIANLLGQNLDENPYRSFTKDDVTAISNSKKQLYLDLINKAMVNVNTRQYLNSYNRFISEQEISRVNFDIINEDLNIVKKRFNIVGYIDGLAYNTTSGRVAVFDLKTNQKNYTADEKIKRAQVVFYLACLIKRGYITTEQEGDISAPFLIEGQTAKTKEEIRTVLQRDQFDTFYDFIRRPESSGIVTISASERAELWDLIWENLEKMADSIVSYENTGRSNQFKTTKKSCNYCKIRPNCPAYTSMDSNVGLNNASHFVEGISAPLIYGPSLQQDKDNYYIEKALNKYYDIARKGSTKLPGGMHADTFDNIGLDSVAVSLKTNYKKRKAALRHIDNKYETQIGAIYISSAVTSLSVVDTKRHTTSDTLRSMYPSVHRSSGSERQVLFTIRFDSAKSINSELRHIIAQCQASPYIHIRNADLTRTVLPFDTNKDIYWGLGDPKVQNLVNRYIDIKGVSMTVDYGSSPDSDNSTSGIKNKIYRAARLFYSITEYRISPIPNLVDAVDLIMRLQLIDISTVSSTGGLEYLRDTNATFLQLAHISNTNIELVRQEGTVANSLYKLHSLGKPIDPGTIKNTENITKIVVYENEPKNYIKDSSGQLEIYTRGKLSHVPSTDDFVNPDIIPLDNDNNVVKSIKELRLNLDDSFRGSAPDYVEPNTLIEMNIKELPEKDNNYKIVMSAFPQPFDINYTGENYRSSYIAFQKDEKTNLRLPNVINKKGGIHPSEQLSDLFDLEYKTSVYKRFSPGGPDQDILIASWATGNLSANGAHTILTPIAMTVKGNINPNQSIQTKNHSKKDFTFILSPQIVEIEGLYLSSNDNMFSASIVGARHDHPACHGHLRSSLPKEKYAGRHTAEAPYNKIHYKEFSVGHLFEKNTNQLRPNDPASDFYYWNSKKPGKGGGGTSALYSLNSYIARQTHAIIDTNELLSEKDIQWGQRKFDFTVTRITLKQVFQGLLPTPDYYINKDISFGNIAEQTESIALSRIQKTRQVPHSIGVLSVNSSNNKLKHYPKGTLPNQHPVDSVFIDIITLKQPRIRTDKGYGYHYLSFPYIKTKANSLDWHLKNNTIYAPIFRNGGANVLGEQGLAERYWIETHTNDAISIYSRYLWSLITEYASSKDISKL